ncbi:hypothetical protein F0U44_16190 [Nocardioides humilatus]|uniref:Collagen-like protein n=1 Tax=Nocardioides humilatus TaxID=2607660 RepID=A0A5B1LAR0_9ACTN|nr:collagen-like protein [Nocardioides humilatus]KAA1417823.1 hypothetical protein F0U44_16190 [Nocardioides humilatus]
MKISLQTTVIGGAIAGALIITSAATGAVAGALITSADIQDDTVRSVDVRNGSLAAGDLSVAARESLRGQTGPQGEVGPRGPRGLQGIQGLQGYTGDTGAPGAPGAPGMSGYQIITGSSGDYGGGEYGSYTLRCPAGKKVIWGAVNWSFTYGGTTFQENITENGNAFEVYGYNDTGNTHYLYVKALCVFVS